MLSHVHVGITDFQRAYGFYAPVMAILGLTQKFFDEDEGWAGWKHPNADRPLFLIGYPYDGKTATPGNGPMTAFLAATRKVVDEVHAAALAHGGTCEGPPGLRLHYHPNYYGAYFRDPDGNKLAVACHEPA